MTRIAVYADLHGNIPALRAFEKDLAERGLTRLWCLGDIVGKGPDNDVTCDWARAHSELILRGNWDSGIGFREYPRDEYYWKQLGEERMAFLRSLPLEKEVTVSGRRVRMMHGRPLMDPLLFVQDESSKFASLLGENADILLWADTHRMGVRLPGHHMQIINCGSVGNGLGINEVQYCIMEGEIGEEKRCPISFTMVSVPYDCETAALRALETELPGREQFAEEVRTGYYAR